MFLHVCFSAFLVHAAYIAFVPKQVHDVLFVQSVVKLSLTAMTSLRHRNLISYTKKIAFYCANFFQLLVPLKL